MANVIYLKCKVCNNQIILAEYSPQIQGTGWSLNVDFPKLVNDLFESCHHDLDKTTRGGTQYKIFYQKEKLYVQNRPENYYRDKYRKKIKENPEAVRIYQENYRKKNKDYYSAKSREWRLRNKHKVAAHQKLHSEINKGNITKLPCMECGEKNSQGHHTDYSKPLQVVWLCRKHHMIRHRTENRPK